MTETEARDLLCQYGPIESCWLSSETEREMYQLPQGIWVKFQFFQDCRDAQSVSLLRMHPGNGSALLASHADLRFAILRDFAITTPIDWSSHQARRI